MSCYRRVWLPGGSYFFTVVTYRRRPILCDEPVREALRAAIAAVRQRRPFVIEAWVLLPDHLHCIWTLPPGDADYATRWGLIKRAVARACAEHSHRPDWLTPSRAKHREATLWQRRFWEHTLRDEEDYSRHVDYIHFNPVKHGWVQRVRDWPYSTFHRYVRQGWLPADWGEVLSDLPTAAEP